MPGPDPGIHLFRNAGLPGIWAKTRFELMPGNDEGGNLPGVLMRRCADGKTPLPRQACAIVARLAK
jgi:hypothetical protein